MERLRDLRRVNDRAPLVDMVEPSVHGLTRDELCERSAYVNAIAALVDAGDVRVLLNRPDPEEPVDGTTLGNRARRRP